MLHDYFNDIISLAESSPTREICGFLLCNNQGSLVVRPVRNIAESNDEWEISSEDYLAALKTGILFGMFHSHVSGETTEPTPADIAASDKSELPMFIYSVPQQKFSFYRPLSSIKEYEGRVFIAGAQDCANLVMDYYEKELGIKIPFVTRPPKVIESGFGDIETFLSNEVVRVYDEPRKNDLFVFSIGGGLQNHVGVYMGDSFVLHQLIGRTSSIESYSRSFRVRTEKVLRPR